MGWLGGPGLLALDEYARFTAFRGGACRAAGLVVPWTARINPSISFAVDILLWVFCGSPGIRLGMRVFILRRRVEFKNRVNSGVRGLVVLRLRSGMRRFLGCSPRHFFGSYRSHVVE